MTTQRPLKIVTDAPEPVVARLIEQGHTVVWLAEEPYATCDLYIAANAWHLPANVPSVDTHVDLAVAWMQRHRYPSKPKKEPIRGRSKRTV